MARKTEIVQFKLFDRLPEPVNLGLDAEHQTFWATADQIANIFAATRERVTEIIEEGAATGEIDLAEATRLNGEIPELPADQPKYNLDVILHVGYQVNTSGASEFRKWATKTLTEYLTQGIAINEGLLESQPDQLYAVYEKIRSIRLSEQSMYERVRHVFKEAASDYSAESSAARSFFAMAQDKFHYAITGMTAADIILTRASAAKPKMGIQTCRGEEPTKDEVTVGKNYLDQHELHALQNISEQFLLFAESKAFRGHKMTMEELATKLNVLLMANDYPVLYSYDTPKRTAANRHANAEYAKYKGLPGGGKRALPSQKKK